MAQPLHGITVLEVGASLGAAYCGKQLAEFGARVISLEPPGGGATRIPPYCGAASDIEASAVHLFLDTAKESAVFDLDAPVARAALAELVSRVDVVLHSLPPERARGLGLMPDEALRRWPSTVFASVTPFGLEGPWAQMPATEMAVAALSTYVYITGDPGREPLAPFAHQVETAGGQVATIGVLAALRARDRDGLGDYVDTALIEVGTSALDAYVIGGYSYLGRNRTRGGNLIGALDILRTSDGFVHVAALAQQAWEGLALAAGCPQMVDDPRLATPQLRIQNPGLISDYLRPWASSHTSAEVFAGLQEMRIPSAISESVQDLLDDPQVAARQPLREIDHPRAGRLKYTAGYFLSDNVELRHERAPLLGEHQGSLEELRARPALAPRQDADARRLPLDGVRIVDLTQVWAAPFATVLLAELGADVIHIESPTRPDMTRWWTVNLDIDGPLWEKSAYYGQHNRGKRSLILNLAHESARDVLKQLVAKADVLINNFSARVMGNWGFTYEAMLEVNPRLVYLTMPSFGATGPYRDCVAFGEALEGACGFIRGRGYARDEPRRSGSAMSDPYAAFAAATLVLAGLRHRDLSGDAVYFDLSQRDASIRLAGEELLAYQATGIEPAQFNNSHREWVPHRVYRCAGEDRWVAIAACSDDEWQALCRVIARNDLGADASLATADGRRARQGVVDEAIAAWTGKREAKFVETQMLRSGVPAAVVISASEAVEHPQFAFREFFPWVEHPFAGPRQFHTTPVMLRARPGARTARRAPLFGEHTHEVLSGVVGLSAEQIAALEAEGAVGGEPDVTGVVVLSE